MTLDFSDLPSETRVKMTEEGEEDLWHRVEEFGGIKNLSEAFDFSASKMYNWKNKGSFMPLKFVKRLMGENPSKIKAVKGKSRGKSCELKFPLSENDELLTRIQESVNLSEGTPIYQVKDQGLVNRFSQLLEELGDIPYTVYRRESVFELRYPRYMHKVFDKMSYSQDFAALVDETGSVEGKYVEIDNERKRITDFDGELQSRDKALKLALARGNKQKVRDLMVEEAEKVERAFKR